MNVSDDAMTKNNFLNKMVNSRYVIISVLIYFLLTQFVHVVIPVKYLNEQLVSHTILFILVSIAICFLSLFYNPENIKVSNVNKFICYSICGIICCVAINFPYGIWLNKLPVKPKEYAIYLSYGPVAKFYFLVLLCLVGPIVEEIYCRLYIYNMIKADFDVTIGIAVSAFLYMVLHGLRIDFIHLFIPGVVYALVYEKTKSIWSSVVVHGFNNLIWFSLVYYA